jgi:hypothetical protein
LLTFDNQNSSTLLTISLINPSTEEVTYKLTSTHSNSNKRYGSYPQTNKSDSFSRLPIIYTLSSDPLYLVPETSYDINLVATSVGVGQQSTSVNITTTTQMFTPDFLSILPNSVVTSGAITIPISPNSIGENNALSFQSNTQVSIQRNAGAISITTNPIYLQNNTAVRGNLSFDKTLINVSLYCTRTNGSFNSQVIPIEASRTLPYTRSTSISTHITIGGNTMTPDKGPILLWYNASNGHL